MTTGPMTTRTARMSELHTVTELCMDAFADEAVIAWVVPDTADRHTHMRTMFGQSLGSALEAGSLIVAQTPDGEMVGASMWLPNTTGTESEETEAAGESEAAGAAGTADHNRRPGPADCEQDPVARRLALLEAAVGGHAPGVPHLHLSSMATLPAYRGRGAGRAMLHAGLGRASELRLPVYLEASTSDNKRLYTSLGFRDVGGSITLPDGGPSVQPMWLADPRAAVCERA